MPKPHSEYDVYRDQRGTFLMSTRCPKCHERKVYYRRGERTEQVWCANCGHDLVPLTDAAADDGDDRTGKDGGMRS